MTTCTDFNQLAKEIHADCVAAGWWADMNRPIRRTLMLVISELSEAMEGDRKNLMDDHLPHRKMLEVELADACIRMLDLGGRYGWEFKHQYYSHPLNGSVPEELFQICEFPHRIFNHFYSEHPFETMRWYSSFLVACARLAYSENLDLFDAIHEKRIYNQQRADHKPAARAAQHGKKY
jgi:hypothetical protein